MKILTESTEFVDIRCFRLIQPIGTFYVGVADHEDLNLISYADVRKLINNEMDNYLGIQRQLSMTRLKELRQYVTNTDATFPTGVILAVNSEFAEFFEEHNVLRIAKRTDVAKILDGQHRLAGLDGFVGKFQLPVIIFVDMDLEDQALTFATINLKQTKVNKSLAYDLFEYSNRRSPQRTCHDLAKVLNKSPQSPFHRNIKILGSASPEFKERLTQAAFVEKFLSFITTDPMRDRDLIKRGHHLSTRENNKTGVTVWRHLFIENRDVEMLNLISSFYLAIGNKWPRAWYKPEPGIMLGRTNGFLASAELLRHICSQNEKFTDLEYAHFREYLENVKLKDSDFSIDRFPPGSSGQSTLLAEFLKAI